MRLNRSLRILAINWQDITNPMGGGAEVHFHEIFKRVAEAGHNVTLLCCQHPGTPAEEVIDGIRIIRRGKRNFFNFHVPLQYRSLRRENDFDVVIDDLNKIPFYTPLFVREPIVTIVHHFFAKSIYLEAPFLPASYVYCSEKLVPAIYRNLHFAVVSESTRREMRNLGIRGPIDLLPNAVDLVRYQYKPDLKSQVPLIGYMGRLKKYKNVEHLLTAMPEILKWDARVRLIVIGDGDHRAELEKLTYALDIAQQVSFKGHVTHEEKVRLLNQLWLTVNPSPKEGWGLTVIEANACGLPTVSADSPGLRDSVVHGTTGLLYPFGQTDQLVTSVISLLQNQQKRMEMAVQARNWAKQFNWDESAQKALDIIKRTIYERRYK